MKLARKLNAFDATLIVAGGIIGAGIFRNPSVVAQRVHTTPLILAVWIFGGFVAIVGGFIFAELAWRRPASGGLYGYMRDAFHPSVAFMYGWTALWVSQSGGMAAAAMTFSAYVVPLWGNSVATWIPAAAIVIALSAINCVGVREGGTTQNLLMLLKIAVIGALIVGGIVAAPISHHGARASAVSALTPMALLSMFGAALVPVLYAYDGWQIAPFMDGELKDPRRTLPLGLIVGVAIVIVLYLAVTAVSVRVLGASGLAATDTPASDIMRIAFGPVGERVIAVGVALSTLGFISNQILTSPRIYYAMANDGLFFRSLAWVHPKTRAPVVAIVVQAIVAVAIAAWGRYDQILNYVTAMDFIFLGLAGIALFVFARDTQAYEEAGVRVPFHPWSTGFFVLVSAAVVVNTYITFPKESLIGLAILLSALPVYWIWRLVRAPSDTIPAG